MESVNQSAKIRKWRSENTVSKKNLNHYWIGVPTITALFAAFDTKAFNCTELLNSTWLAEQDY